jgi:hypothetical protein
MAAGPLLQDGIGNTINGLSSPDVSSPIDPENVLEYLAQVIRAVFAGSEQDLATSLLSSSAKNDILDRCQSFAQQANLPLYIHKEEVSSPDEDIIDTPSGMNYLTMLRCFQAHSPL